MRFEKDSLRWVLWFPLGLVLAYILLVFPFTYFRHDDWLILGNAVRYLVLDWASAFDPTLYYVEDETDWFFRPLFKVGVFLFFKLFGYHYFAWLILLSLFFVAALYISYRTVLELTHSPFWSSLMVIFLGASIHIHFGSLTWMGEGMMNCPQLFLLSLSTYCFVKALKRCTTGNFAWSTLAFLSLLLALGYKESSVFHVGFLVLLSGLPVFSHLSVKDRVRVALPFILLGSLYLPIRLFWMPINPYYVPKFSAAYMLPAIGKLTAAYALPFLVWLGISRFYSKSFSVQFLKKLTTFWLYGLFLIVSLLPYLGHTFFSPGWLMVPSYYFFLVLCLAGKESQVYLPRAVLGRVTVALFIFCFIPVGFKLYSVRWWRWHEGQRHMQSVVSQASPDKIKSLVVYNCRNRQFPKLGVDRVIGFEAGLYQLWALQHTSTIPIHIRRCADTDRFRTVKDSLILRWEFPTLTWVNESVTIAKNE